MHLDMLSNENEKLFRNQNDSDASSTISEESEPKTSRIGESYQAPNVIIDAQISKLKDSQNQLKETLIWTPCNKLTDTQIEEYLFFARAKYGYNIDQALAMLYWHKHDIEKALVDMNNYVPIPDEWSYEDKILFERAFLYHGKNFNKIRTALPDKSQASLVNYYYMWKKTRNHKSLMDYLQNKNNNYLDEKEKDEDNDYGTMNSTNICCNCDEINQELQSTPKGMMCNLCYNYWKRTGVMRPEHVNNYAVSNKTINNKHYNSGSEVNFYLNNNTNKESRNILKSFRKPPKGVYLNYEELINLTELNQAQIFERLNNKILSLKRQMQSNKQQISILTSKFIDTDKLLISNYENLNKKFNITSSILTSKWTQREAELAIQGFYKYGKNFNAISEIIETKSEDSIRAFFEYHKTYTNLDEIISNKNICNNLNELKIKAAHLVSETKDKLNSTQLNNIQNDDSSNDDVIIL